MDRSSKTRTRGRRFFVALVLAAAGLRCGDTVINNYIGVGDASSPDDTGEVERDGREGPPE